MTHAKKVVSETSQGRADNNQRSIHFDGGACAEDEHDDHNVLFVVLEIEGQQVRVHFQLT